MIRNVVESLLHNKGRSFLVLSLCAVSFFLFLTTMTNAAAFYKQNAQVKSMFKSNAKQTYRVDFSYIQDVDNAGYAIAGLKEYINSIPGAVCGAYDESGEYFEELMNNDEYVILNSIAYAGTFRELAPQIAEVVFLDSSLLNIVNSSLEAALLNNVSVDGNDYSPIFVGNYYRDCIDLGDILTLSRNGTKYIVAGYLEDASWLNDSDPITMPLISLERKFFASFSKQDTVDAMTQQSTVGKIFINLSSESSAIPDINRYATENGMKVRIASIYDFCAQWENENRQIISLNFFSSIIVLICSMVSIVSTLCVTVLLKKREYGIRIAFGASLCEMMKTLALEIFCITTVAAAISLIYVNSLFSRPERSLFNTVYRSTLFQISLPCLVVLALVCFLLNITIPMNILRKCEPASLIKEDV